MADRLGMTTTADGLETERELEPIRHLGCTKIRGYYFGQAVSAGDAARLFPGQAIAAGAACLDGRSRT